MNSQVVFTIDEKTKKRAMQRAKAAGVPFASVLKMATRKFANGHLSVDIFEPERFNEKTARALRRALQEVKAGKVVSFDTIKEMDAHLLS